MLGLGKITHVSDLCITLDFNISIWVLILRLCLNLAKSFWPPSIKDRLICLPTWLKFLLRLLPCIPKTAIAFPRALPMPLANTQLRESGILTLCSDHFLLPLSHQAQAACPHQDGSSWHTISSAPHGDLILASKQATRQPQCFFCLPSYHSSYWGTGAFSSICKAPTVLFPNQITLSMMLPKKEKKSSSTLCSIS